MGKAARDWDSAFAAAGTGHLSDRSDAAWRTENGAHALYDARGTRQWRQETLLGLGFRV